MRIRVEVVGRSLNLRGPQYAVGERLYLDLNNPTHREALDSGWVRRLDDPGRSQPPQQATPVVTVALETAPVDRMMKPGRRKAATKETSEQ